MESVLLLIMATITGKQ